MFQITFEVDPQILLWFLLKKTQLLASECSSRIGPDEDIPPKPEDFPESMRHCLKGPRFMKLLEETKDYARQVQYKWQDKKRQVYIALLDILRIPVDGEFTCFIVHPETHTGRSLHQSRVNAFVWGHYSHFPNYDVIYLIHEMMHSIFPFNPIAHTVQELAIDNELRVRLNHGSYDEKTVVCGIGREKIISLMLPEWRRYLVANTENIFQFIERMEKKFELSRFTHKN